jgi:hypothetical protein
MRKIHLVLTNPKGLDKSVEITPQLKRKIIKETMKEIQELYYDIEEPQEDYDWQCDKGMIKRAITSSIENLIKELINS